MQPLALCSQLQLRLTARRVKPACGVRADPAASTHLSAGQTSPLLSPHRPPITAALEAWYRNICVTWNFLQMWAWSTTHYSALRSLVGRPSTLLTAPLSMRDPFPCRPPGRPTLTARPPISRPLSRATPARRSWRRPRAERRRCARACTRPPPCASPSSAARGDSSKPPTPRPSRGER